MNRRGFTLIELLATVMILSLIMLVAVPNVMSTIDKNKQDTYVEDAKQMITLAEYEIRSNTDIDLPDDGNCIVIRLEALDLSSLSDAPEGGTYDLRNSYVVIARSGSNLIYMSTITEKYNCSEQSGTSVCDTRGILLTSRDNLNSDKARDYVVKNEDLIVTNPKVGSSLQLEESSFTVSNIIGNS